MAITVTNGAGATLPDVHVEVSGRAARTGDTDASGQINFPGLQPGTYTLRFTGEGVMGFEREVTLTSGKVAQLQIALHPLPSQPAAPPPPAPKAAIGPAGSPQWGSLPDLAKKAQQAKEPRREILIACSGNERSMLLLLSENQPQRLYDDADSVYYVVDGQGSIKIGDREGDVGSGWFSSVPHGTPFSISRRGNKPLVLLWVLSGAPCEESR